MFFWAVVFLLTTTAVALFKHESPLNRDGTRDPELDVRETYSQLLRITGLRPVRTLIAILLTVKVGEGREDGFWRGTDRHTAHRQGRGEGGRTVFGEELIAILLTVKVGEGEGGRFLERD